VVVERERPGGGRVALSLQDPGGPEHERAQRFESELSAVTGGLWNAVEAGHTVQLDLLGEQSVVGGDDDRERALRRLAVIEVGQP
jgi:hypothetical protein